MYRLIEVVKQDGKESQAIYPFEEYLEAKGEYETKLGADMKATAYSGVTLLIIDSAGFVTDVKHTGEELRPRLIEIKTKEEEIPDISPYDTEQLVEANLHSKFGAAIKDEDVVSEVIRGIDGKGDTIKDENGKETGFIYWIRPVEAPEPEPTPEEETEPTE